MSSDYLTHLNSAVAEFQKTVYLEGLTRYPYPMEAPVYTMIPHNESYVTTSPKWKLDSGTYDGISFGSQIRQDSGIIEGDEASLDMKQMSQILEFNRLSTLIMKNPRASAIDLVKKSFEKANLERAKTLESLIVSSDTTGAAGTIDTEGVVDKTGGSYTLTISDATWAYGKWRRRGMFNVGTSLDIFDVTNIDDINHKVTVLRRSGGSKVPVAGDILYRHGAKDNYPNGLKEIIEGSGSLHGISRRHGWESLKLDWSNKALSEQRLLELFSKIYARSQEYPDMLLLPPSQMLRLSQMVRDNSIRIMDATVERKEASGKDKSYEVPNVTHLMLNGKAVKLVEHPDMPMGSGYFINTKHLELVSVGPGDFVPTSEGGSNLTHMGLINGTDRFKALWIYYYALRCDMPGAHGGFVNAISATSEDLF